MSDEFPFTLQVPGTSRHPPLTVAAGRITVLLGSNGTGKSALLESMHNTIAPAFGLRQTRKVNARRIMQVIGKSSLKRAEVNDNIEQIANSMLESSTIDVRQMQTEASKLLEALCHRDRRRDIDYAKMCDELAKRGQQEAVRPKPISPLDEFRELFKSALPELDLDFDTSTVSLKIRKRGMTVYGPESLSSGEQQIFLLLGKFIFAHPKAVFLIDEPELNLNPRLAERFWSVIERRHPDCAFVYATHALHFALRPEVDRALVLTRSEVVSLDESREFLQLAREDREQFLGSIPSIVLAQKVLFTEGEPDSIDRSLYEYLLRDQSIKVECIGSCEEVEKAVAGRQGWERFTRDAKVGGVIDADYKPDSDVDRLRRLNVFVLPFHEAESVLCHPHAVEALSLAMHPPSKQIKAAQVVDALRTRILKQRIPIALRRAAALFRAPLAPSVPASDVNGLNSDADAIAAFERTVEGCFSLLRQKDPQATLVAELARIDKALSNNDVSAMMRLFPGKELTRQIRSILEIKGRDHDLLAYYQKHVPNADLPVFLEIRDSLRRLFLG